jgi:hypothetical protein
VDASEIMNYAARCSGSVTLEIDKTDPDAQNLTEAFTEFNAAPFRKR